MMHRAWTLAGLAGLLLVASCDDPASSERDPAVGTYVLATVDGRPLPVAEWSGISGYTGVEFGELTLRRDGTYRDVSHRTHHVRDPRQDIQMNDTVEGMYTRQGNTVVLRSAGAADTLTIEGAGAVRWVPIVRELREPRLRWEYRR
ncbi:MAG TPA: hypothetical protein VK399_12980 [Longimicrobiaceae bacterium]|nr:hypothetical protein [Longimicrobiaceae bacterium]